MMQACFHMSALVDYFDIAYILNLPERADRRREITEKLATIDVQLAPGRVELFPAIKPTHPGGFENIGIRGCFESHLAMYRRALAEGKKSLLIIEDDLTPLPELREFETAVLEKL